MDIRFIGTGGGRFCMIQQLRQTGGFVLHHDGFSMYVDPAPGALVHGLQNDVPFQNLDAVFVSHGHLDHQGDLEVVVEAMTNGCTEKRGILIGNETVLEGSEEFERSIDDYHREALASTVTAQSGTSHTLDDVRLTFRETRHKDIQTTGFQLTTQERTLSYIPDTGYFEELPERFDGSDYLVMNVLRPHDRDWEGHLNLEEALQLIREIGPEQALLQHFGASFIQSFREQYQWLEEQNDTETDIVFASDNTLHSFEEKNLERYV
ncbi:MAG: MBL fold metallo-hydrolase [Candidatus Nanohaloarchaea archaeon]|nr:MBL fold metallo-hydrolase [Candidatus Nanohaloarchaea archaeon]